MIKTILILWLAASTLLHADLITLDFDTAPQFPLDEVPWMEEGRIFTVSGLPQDPGNYSVEKIGGELFLTPGQIHYDLSGLGITKIETDIHDSSGVGATRLFVTDSSGNVQAQVLNTTTNADETLILDIPGGISGQLLIIESSATSVAEIRITTADPEIVFDFNPPNQPAGTILLCWPPDIIMERSQDLVNWEVIPDNEIDKGGVWCHFANRIQDPRYFYRYPKP